MTIAHVSLETICARLNAQHPFAFTRWGDGEWQAILGRQGETCDHQPYSPALQWDLTRVLESRPSYVLGLQRYAVARFGGEIRQWLEARQLELPWIDADVFHRASRDGTLEPFLLTLRRRAVVLVGPSYLLNLGLFARLAHVQVPERDGYASYTSLRDHVRSTLLPFCSDRVVVVVSAGPTAKILIHDLQAEYPQHAFVDVGALWEPYVGKITRTYHRQVVERLSRRSTDTPHPAQTPSRPPDSPSRA